MTIQNPILCYHGVTKAKSRGIENFSGKHMPAAQFEEQMKYIRKYMNPVPLRALAEILQRGDEPSANTIAVTFDDSYKNVYDVAVPILKKYKIPATFFITTSLVGTQKMYWTDQVEHWINRATVAKLDGFDIGSDELKMSAVRQIKYYLKNCTKAVRAEFLAMMGAALGFKEGHDGVENYQNLMGEDVQEMGDCMLFEIGGHSWTHEVLAGLTEDELHTEIFECLQDIIGLTRKKTDLFSYPEGQLNHFNQAVIDKLKSCGIKICPTAMDGSNPPGTDPFQLHRTMVGFMGQDFLGAVRSCGKG